MVLPQRRKSMLSQEEKKARLKETRQKYSQLGRAAASKLAPRPLTVPLQRAPTAPRASIAPTASKRPIEKNDDDFEVDPKSLAMIKNCKVTMPVSRPSISSRNTLGARQSIIGRLPARSRVSMAPEPRTSLLPLGINVFDASATQRNEISEYMNSLVESTKTPGKTTTTTVACSSTSSSTTNVFGSLLNSTRHRKIRFMDAAIQEVRESAESAEVAEVTAAATHHSPTADTSFMPTSILSTRKKERKRVDLDAPAPRTPRKLNFDDEDSAENSKISENITHEKNEKEIAELEKIVDNLCTAKLSDCEAKRVQDAIEKLKKSLEASQKENTYRTPLKRAFPIAPVPMTPLGAIMESLAMNEGDEGDEEEVDEEEKAFLERKKTRRRSSKMKVGGDARRSINRRVSRGSLKRE